MKNFFGIEEKFRFEWNDLFTLLTICNVSFILLGWHYAPIFGIVNCVCAIVSLAKHQGHINMYIMQVSLIILNVYFLTL